MNCQKLMAQLMSTQGNDMSIDSDFKRGSKTSSSIMEDDITPEQVEQFMKTSFYLPVDILKHPDWKVGKIEVMSGAAFNWQWNNDGGEIHCVEAPELLCAAQFVAVSQRYSKRLGKTYYVCKIWYGAAPK